MSLGYVECAHCGETVGTYYVTCPYCGYKLDKPEPFFPLSLDWTRTSPERRLTDGKERIRAARQRLLRQRQDT